MFFKCICNANKVCFSCERTVLLSFEKWILMFLKTELSIKNIGLIPTSC